MKNKSALLYGALLALIALWRHMGVPTFLFRPFATVDDFTYKNIKEFGQYPRKLWPF